MKVLAMRVLMGLLSLIPGGVLIHLAMRLVMDSEFAGMLMVVLGMAASVYGFVAAFVLLLLACSLSAGALGGVISVLCHAVIRRDSLRRLHRPMIELAAFGAGVWSVIVLIGCSIWQFHFVWFLQGR